MSAFSQITSPANFETERHSLDWLFLELESHLDLGLPDDFGLVLSEETFSPQMAPHFNGRSETATR